LRPVDLLTWLAHGNDPEALDNKELQAQMQKAGVQPQWSSPEAFRSIVEKGIVRYRSIARSKNIELQ